ncbi:hypothetical protein [Paenibacillus planticolens]|uniref:Uncharacterized protein n=1 Tax=Paenibacillus planticolens TaxID=2654976 RepID=A0ABX1ZN53_9BACL|nr:hypothetical protein [Paenibacillus planticolens]NOV01512.1 hypothetical protein [Paenibacillus planticolens]
MKKNKLLYSTLLLLSAGVIAGGFVAVNKQKASENIAVQPNQVTPSYVDKVTVNLESPPAEEPSVTVLKGATIPDDAALRGAMLNQTMNCNGQGSVSLTYKAPTDSNKEKVRFYVQNIGEKKLYFRLESPQGNNWIKTAVEADTVFVGEMQWGIAQEGLWNFVLNNDDGSVISVKIISEKV